MARFDIVLIIFVFLSKPIRRVLKARLARGRLELSSWALVVCTRTELISKL